MKKFNVNKFKLIVESKFFYAGLIVVGILIGITFMSLTANATKDDFKTLAEWFGTVADWFGAVGTIGAVATSFYILRKSKTEKIIDRDKEILYKVSNEFYNVLQIKKEIDEIKDIINSYIESGYYYGIDEKFNYRTDSNIPDDSIFTLLKLISEKIDKLYKLKNEDIEKLSINSYYLNNKKYNELLKEINDSLKNLNIKSQDVMFIYEGFSKKDYDEHLMEIGSVPIVSYNIVEDETTFRDVINFIYFDLKSIHEKIDQFDQNVKLMMNKY